MVTCFVAVYHSLCHIGKYKYMYLIYIRQHLDKLTSTRLEIKGVISHVFVWFVERGFGFLLLLFFFFCFLLFVFCFNKTTLYRLCRLQPSSQTSVFSIDPCIEFWIPHLKILSCSKSFNLYVILTITTTYI